jgi:hypothetical protein
VIALAIAAAAAVAQPNVVAVIPPEHRLVEGVASDGQTIWVSSVIDRQIIACTDSCRTLAVLPEGLHPLGIAWDWGRKLIWVAADCPGIAGTAKCDKGALVAIDRHGRSHGRIAPKADQFHPGDVFASAAGVFVSDSRNGLIYALIPRHPGLRPINRLGDGKSAQGLALASSGTAIVVADYARGIGMVDMLTKATHWLPGQDGKALRGVDGLIRCGDGFFGIQNGTSPGVLVAIRPMGNRVAVGRPLGERPLPDPTQIAFDGRRLLIVAHSGWANIDRAGFVRTKGAAVVAVPLRRDCKVE